MITRNFYKGQGFRDKQVESQTLIFNDPLPESKTLNDHAQLCDEQAVKICDVLLNTLAQGVTDRILAIMMARRARLFVFPQEDNNQ